MPERTGATAGSGIVHVSAIAAAALAAVVVASQAAVAQKNPYRNYTEEKFVQNMQAAGRNYAAVNDLLAKKDYDAAKAQLTRAREQLAITVTFWRDRKKDDALKLLRDALDRTDDLDNVLSEQTVNPPTADAASRRLSDACQACHSQYREQDPATKAYRLKTGSVQ
jgi:cytochrome c556